MRARYAQQIREGIELARLGGYWGIYGLLAGRKTNLTKRAFIRTQRRSRVTTAPRFGEAS